LSQLNIYRFIDFRTPEAIEFDRSQWHGFKFRTYRYVNQ